MQGNIITDNFQSFFLLLLTTPYHLLLSPPPSNQNLFLLNFWFCLLLLVQLNPLKNNINWKLTDRQTRTKVCVNGFDVTFTWLVLQFHHEIASGTLDLVLVFCFYPLTDHTFVMFRQKERKLQSRFQSIF